MRDHVAADEDQCNPQKIVQLEAENARLRKGLREVLDHMKNGTTWYPHIYEALLRGENDGTQRTS